MDKARMNQNQKSSPFLKGGVSQSGGCSCNCIPSKVQNAVPKNCCKNVSNNSPFIKK